MTTTSDRSGARDLSVLTRPSGGFAMVAIDQRESLRAMFVEHQRDPVPDEQLTGFKLAAARTLSPHASGILIDRDFAFDRVVDEGAVAAGCGLIAAADRFLPSADELVADTEIDERVVPERVASQGAVALKLLVIYRPDGDPARRIALVEDFIGRSREAGLISIIEPVSRAPQDGHRWTSEDRDDGVLAAAAELGSLGADLYKAEMPMRGEGEESTIRQRCAELTARVDSPWVVLSSGVRPDAFPAAVELACREGASGFLAGRAVWAPALGAVSASDNPDRELRDVAVPRLRELCSVVDAAMTPSPHEVARGRQGGEV